MNMKVHHASEGNVLVANRQAIITQYTGPSNVKGARVSARGRFATGRAAVVIAYEHAMSFEKNHRAAREEFCRRNDWREEGITWVQANISDAECVHIALDSHEIDKLFVESTDHLELPALLRRQAD